MGKPDVLIVGGGSAGAVLAARLSEDPHRNVLLEAGPAYPPGGYPPEVANPAMLGLLAGHDWGDMTEPDFNGPAPAGVAPLPLNIVDGTRVNTGMAYLTDAVRARPGPQIRAGVVVDRVTFAGSGATGVILADGTAVEAAEVVLLLPGSSLAGPPGTPAEPAIVEHPSFQDARGYPCPRERMATAQPDAGLPCPGAGEIPGQRQ